MSSWLWNFHSSKIPRGKPPTWLRTLIRRIQTLVRSSIAQSSSSFTRVLKSSSSSVCVVTHLKRKVRNGRKYLMKKTQVTTSWKLISSLKLEKTPLMSLIKKRTRMKRCSKNCRDMLRRRSKPLGWKRMAKTWLALYQSSDTSSFKNLKRLPLRSYSKWWTKVAMAKSKRMNSKKVSKKSWRKLSLTPKPKIS